MPPIRVLQIMPAMDAGGMETFVMNVYRTIDREKVQFDFLYHYDKPCFFDDEIRALGGRIYKLTVRQDNNIPRYLRALRTLFAAHPEWRIIHGHYSGFGMFYNPVAKRAGIPVRCGHSHNTAYEPNLVGQLDRVMSSFFRFGLTDRFACSEKAGQMLYGKAPFTVVPNGIDTARFAARDAQRRALLRGELGVTDQDILFGHVGRFSAQKNHPGLLKIYEDIAREHEIVPILSENAAKYSTRFGTAEDFVTRVEAVAGRRAVRNIVEAEPLGPQGAMEALVIAPCTGNTLAKLANGITDGPVTMAAKGHLRNGKPVVLALATNDGLSASAANIAALLNRKNYYFVPFGQDNAAEKPTSLIADFRKIMPTLEAAMAGRQLQPILL